MVRETFSINNHLFYILCLMSFFFFFFPYNLCGRFDIFVSVSYEALVNDNYLAGINYYLVYQILECMLYWPRSWSYFLELFDFSQA